MAITKDSENLYSSMRFVGDGVTKHVPLTFDLREGDGLAVDFGEGLVTSGYLIDYDVTPVVVVFSEPLPNGKTITIRRLTQIDAVKHIFQWTGNAQGGADFSAKNVDENFEQITRASQDAMDAQTLASETLEEMAGIRDTAIDARDKAKQSETNAKQSELNSKDSELKAKVSETNTKTSETKAKTSELNAKASELEAKLSETNAKDSELNAKESENNSKQSELNAKASEVSASVDASQVAQDKVYVTSLKEDVVRLHSEVDVSANNAKSSELASKGSEELARKWANNPEDVVVQDGEFSAKHWAGKAKGIANFDLTEYRKKDDLLFKGMMQVQATDDVGTGVFLLDKDGNPRGQMTYNSGGLQFAQVQEDGTCQTFTLPRYGDGGEILTDSSLKGDVSFTIPSNYPSLSACLEDISENSALASKVVSVNILDGHIEEEPILLINKDLRNVTVVATSTIKVNVTGDYFSLFNSVSPRMEVLFDGDGKVGTGYNIQNRSSLFVGNRKGFLNCTDRNIYLNNSSSGYLDHVVATNTNAVGRNVWISRDSNASLNGATLSGASDYNVWISRSSNAYGESCKFSNAGIASIGATRFSVASFNLSTHTDTAGVTATYSGDVYLNDATATNITKIPFFLNENGRVVARNFKMESDTLLNYIVECRSASSLSLVNADIKAKVKLSAFYISHGSDLDASNLTINLNNTGVLFDARSNSSISSTTSVIDNINILIQCRESSININDSRITSTKYLSSALSMSKVWMARCGITTETVTDRSIIVSNGSTILATGLKLNGVDVKVSDTNVSVFNKFYNIGTIYV